MGRRTNVRLWYWVFDRVWGVDRPHRCKCTVGWDELGCKKAGMGMIQSAEKFRRHSWDLWHEVKAIFLQRAAKGNKVGLHGWDLVHGGWHLPSEKLCLWD